MCLEDLKLGRGRFARAPVTQVGAGTVTLPADSARVAILLSFTGVSWFDSSAGSPSTDTLTVQSSAGGGLVNVLVCGAINGPIILRIEDLGQLITSAIAATITNQSGFAVVTLTPVCTEVDAAPAMRGYGQ